MEKELLNYKKELIKDGYLVFDVYGNIKDIKTKKEIKKEIKTQEIVEIINELKKQQEIDFTGEVSLIYSLSNINNTTPSNQEVVYIDIKDNNNYINGYVELNKFIILLQNSGCMISISKYENEENHTTTKKEQLINSINKSTNIFEGYKIRIKQKEQIKEELNENTSSNNQR